MMCDKGLPYGSQTGWVSRGTYSRLHLVFFFFFTCRAARVAVSKTSRTPSLVLAEHSKYPNAPATGQCELSQHCVTRFTPGQTLPLSLRQRRPFYFGNRILILILSTSTWWHHWEVVYSLMFSAIALPCSILIGSCFIFWSSLIVCWSFLRSFLLPTRMMGTLGQKCLTC